MILNHAMCYLEKSSRTGLRPKSELFSVMLLSGQRTQKTRPDRTPQEDLIGIVRNQIETNFLLKDFRDTLKTL